MKDKILYFPYIAIPKSLWLTQTLLYWDEVGSIVPMDFAYNREYLGSYMKDLVDHRLVRQIVPAQYIGNIPRFKEAFVDILDRAIVKPQGVEKNRIHLEKLDAISSVLLERGLAVKSEEGNFFDVDTNTAKLFMNYLAVVLGRLPELRMTPATDQEEFMSILRHPIQKAEVGAIRQQVLDRVLPVPKGTITARQIVQFKESHTELLHSFRTVVEAGCCRVATIESIAERQIEAEHLCSDLHDRIDEITRKMEEWKWGKIALNTFSAAIPIIKGIVQPDGSLIESVPALISACWDAYDQKKSASKAAAEPLAYAVYTKRFLGSRT